MMRILSVIGALFLGGAFFNFLHHFRSGKYFCGIAGYADLSGAMSGGLRFASGLVGCQP